MASDDRGKNDMYVSEQSHKETIQVTLLFSLLSLVSHNDVGGPVYRIRTERLKLSQGGVSCVSKAEERREAKLRYKR